MGDIVDRFACGTIRAIVGVVWFLYCDDPASIFMRIRSISRTVETLKQGVALSGLSLGGLSWPSRFCQPPDAKVFVFGSVRMDILLGLDPRNPDVFNEQMAFTRIQTYDRLPNGFSTPLKPT